MNNTVAKQYTVLVYLKISTSPLTRTPLTRLEKTIEPLIKTDLKTRLVGINEQALATDKVIHWILKKVGQIRPDRFTSEIAKKEFLPRDFYGNVGILVDRLNEIYGNTSTH